jgi:hypothetical protein
MVLREKRFSKEIIERKVTEGRKKKGVVCFLSEA